MAADRTWHAVSDFVSVQAWIEEDVSLSNPPGFCIPIEGNRKRFILPVPCDRQQVVIIDLLHAHKGVVGWEFTENTPPNSLAFADDA